MPTEHEFKYVISLDIAEKYDHKSLKSMSDAVQNIKQGYLAFSKGMTLRVRSISDVKRQKWYVTFKQKVNNRVIEIEKKLDARDGVDLWEVCVGRLTKNRYIIDVDGLTWELDYFWKGHHLYFIQAEVELDEGAPRPKKLPDFLNDYILYEVPLTDDRFSNKRLGDAEYANRLYKKLEEKKKNGKA